MSKQQSIKHPAEGADVSARPTGAQDDTKARVLRDLKAASDLVESGAFDLAGHANNDTVSDMIRVVADLQLLITQLTPRRNQ